MKEVFELAIRADNPVLYITGDVEGKMYERVAVALAFLATKGSPDIDVVIDSNGGSVATGLDIYDLIRLYKGKTVGTVISRAASMGAIILQACGVRKCALHAEILIHHISRKSVGLDTLKSKKQHKKLVREMEVDQQRQYDILVKKTGQSKKKIVITCKLDKFMSAEEAKSFGLIDEVV